MTKRFKPDRLIVNPPYKEPSRYWRYVREDRMFELVEDSRRPAGYVRATPGSTSFDDPGIFVELPLVNQIRPRVAAWREAGYAGVTGITKRLLEHWYDPEERQDRRFFFCQLEAIETLIWLTEASPAERQGIEVPGDGGAFQRLCAKMATGSGKTIVMAMVIAWQVLNKVTYPHDTRFSKNVLVIAPGLTVRNRLKVVELDAIENYYDEFNVVPAALVEKLRLGKVKVRNRHKLNWDTEKQLAKKKRVDKRGAKSDEAYTQNVLGDMAVARNILVINDEAHHAWRIPAGTTVVGVSKSEREEATKWIGGLDRIHRSRGILTCYDFTATPFVPLGKSASDESLFGWIISDFGLNDAIESGLVKTPRVVIRDDALPDVRTFKSKLYHIYMDTEVRDNLNRPAEEQEPLPDLVRNAYTLLGADWLETRNRWRTLGYPLPPVMISVANRTQTAARIRYEFEHKRVRIEELTDPDRILHIDSKVLEFAESQEDTDEVDVDGLDEEDEIDAENGEPKSAKLTKKQKAEQLRQTVRTVGQVGKPGEQIQKVISVGMLSEGWDAKTVTHIMGLRAFSSQLLCEQVVGRGLRRTSYDVNPETGMFMPEYVNIFGVPFTFMPHEEGDGPAPPPPDPKTKIEPHAERADFAISWPNVIRIDHVYRPTLTLDLAKVRVLTLHASEIRTIAELAPVIDNKPDVTRLSEIVLEDLARRFRFQKIVFEAARDVYDQIKPGWRGNREYLLAQVVGLVEGVLRSDRIVVEPPLFNQEDGRRRIALTLSMTKIVQHIWDAIRDGNAESLALVFDRDHPIRSTHDMQPWYTSRPCERTQRSHINHCVYDGTWEACEAFELDRNPAVSAWVKNDHLGFEIVYVYNGVVHKYRPDFLIRLTNGKMLVLEVKGQDTQKDKTKRSFLDEWVRAVNDHGGFGRWACDVSKEPREVAGVLAKHATEIRE